jgi:CopG family nickel-responsive transcriptional regulator
MSRFDVISNEAAMQRVTITLDDEFVKALDGVIATRGYQNRSEAIRDLARAGIRQMAEQRDLVGDCVAALVYVYDHDARELSKRLTHIFHDHHDLSLSSMHVHLDHGSCMEVAVLKGEAGEVRHLADHVIAERGVRHGRVVMVPVSVENEKHAHAGKTGHRHMHVHVQKAG